MILARSKRVQGYITDSDEPALMCDGNESEEEMFDCETETRPKYEGLHGEFLCCVASFLCVDPAQFVVGEDNGGRTPVH